MKATWPRFADDEIRAVNRVLRSGRVNQWTGEEVSKFEEEFAKFVGATYAVAYANGSLALEAAFACLEKKGDVVIPARTFVATAMSAIRAGLRPVFADVEENGLASRRTLSAASHASVICTVHLGGKVAEAEFPGKTPVIEDCAQAMGARKDGKHVGTFGKIGVFSFCQDKIMTTGGEGGMIVTSDYMLYRKLWSWKDHGKSYELAHQNAKGAYKWCHTGIGTNARMTEMQAAIGRVQLRKVPEWVEKRRALATRLHEQLQGCRALRTVPVDYEEAAYRYYAYTDDDLQVSWSRDRIVTELNARGLQCGQGSCPEIYREQAFYTGLQFCNNAKRLGLTSIMFKIDPTMSLKDVDRAAAHTKEVMAKACLRSA